MAIVGLFAGFPLFLAEEEAFKKGLKPSRLRGEFQSSSGDRYLFLRGDASSDAQRLQGLEFAKERVFFGPLKLHPHFAEALAIHTR